MAEKTKLNCTPFEEAAVRTESELDWKVPEEQLIETVAAIVNSPLCHLLMASKMVLVSQDGLSALFY